MSGSTLKELRADLTAHLAQGLSASAPKIGQLVNPPAVVVQPGSPYVTATGYCADEIAFVATIIAPPGDLAAVIDALDDMVDEVRSTLRTKSTLGSSGGFLYRFVDVSGPSQWVQGDEPLPAVNVNVAVERESP